MWNSDISTNRRFLLSNYGGVVCSTDDFFVENGEYRFQPEKLEEYHRSNILRVRNAMIDGIKPIIVDNTNIFTNHMEQYALHAVTHCYEIFVVEPETSWRYAVKECFRRNVHGVDKSKIHSMLQSLEEQGRPPLSRLVGKGRQVKLEPPCNEVECGPIGQFSSMGPAIFPPSALNNGITPLSTMVTSNDRPPGLPDPNAMTIFAKLFPHGAAPAPSSSPASLSLAPDPHPHIRKVTLRDMATQTNEVVGGFIKMLGFDECVKLFVEVGAYVDWSASVVEGAFIEDLAAAEMSGTCPHAPPPRTDWQRIAEQEGMNDRSTGMSPTQTESQRSASPQANAITVTLGVDILQKMSILFGARKVQHDTDAELASLLQEGEQDEATNNFVKGAFIEDLAAAEMSGTCPHAPSPRTDWLRIAEQEGMNDRSTGISPTQAESQRSASPQANAITVTLGVDILQKMSVLFGNGAAVERECDLSVPLWLLEQLYLVWQGGARKVQHDTDAELASLLQDGEQDEATNNFVKKQMTVAQKLNLNELVKEFSSCDSECVRRIFEDNRYDAAATRVTLRVMLNPDDEIENLEQIAAASLKLSKQVPPPPLSRTCPRPEPSLPSAQEQALQFQRQANAFAAKRSNETKKAQGYIRSGLLPAAAVSHQIAREYAACERNLRAQATDLIIKAHENSNFLDLHLLSQKDALALLRERLELLDRPESMRNGRSDRRLRAITGYGKNSGGRAVIKPAVEAYLKRNGYIYWFANMGEVVIHCK
ncbi:Smr domain protein [Ancylostoma caninum]|uniref:Smr domain protein n=1 Tax=Ancylostoma caninum TaxID=29170 RepID=A0A368GDW2_ANCCA|nr:Smr domain protein [Ancylostoma caninum]